MFQLNRTISYTKSWRSTLFIALLLSGILSFILIFLEPFDTYSVQMDHKELKLLGYAIPLHIAVLSIHILENYWFSKLDSWKLINEIVIVSIGFFWISFLSFFYLNSIVNPYPLSLTELLPWIKNFALPFAPILLSLWIYFRYRFSSIDLKLNGRETPTRIRLEGMNNNEVYEFFWQDFYFCKAQSNYVDLFIKKDDAIEKVVIRSSFANIIDQLPKATQVHRSFAINLAHLKVLQGNSRKGFCELHNVSETIPVSPKHFNALKTMLQNRH